MNVGHRHLLETCFHSSSLIATRGISGSNARAIFNVWKSCPATPLWHLARSHCHATITTIQLPTVSCPQRDPVPTRIRCHPLRPVPRTTNLLPSQWTGLCALWPLWPAAVPCPLCLGLAHAVTSVTRHSSERTMLTAGRHIHAPAICAWAPGGFYLAVAGPVPCTFVGVCFSSRGCTLRKGMAGPRGHVGLTPPLGSEGRIYRKSCLNRVASPPTCCGHRTRLHHFPNPKSLLSSLVCLEATEGGSLGSAGGMCHQPNSLLCRFSGRSRQKDRWTLCSPSQPRRRAEFEHPGPGRDAVNPSPFLQIGRQGALLCRRNPVPPSCPDLPGWGLHVSSRGPPTHAHPGNSSRQASLLWDSMEPHGTGLGRIIRTSGSGGTCSFF